MKRNYVKHFSKVASLVRRSIPRTSLFLKASILCLFLSGNLFSQVASVLNSQSPQQNPWDVNGLKHELVNKRTRTSKHFMKEGNNVSAFISPSSIHYMDNNNAWKDINTSIVTNSGVNSQSHPYASIENSVKTWFPSNPFTNYILMNSKEGSYKERVTAINFLDNNNNVLSSLSLTGNVTSVVNGNKIIYAGFNQHLSLEYTMGNDGRKFDLIIQSNAFLNSIPVGAASISIEEEFISEGNSTRFEVLNNEVDVYVKGTNVFKFTQPMAFDSNPLSDEGMNGSTTLQSNNDVSVLKTKFPLAWIQANNRHFPIHLDPTVSYYPQFTTYWTGYQTSSTAKTSGYLRITGNTTAAWAKFDLTSLPSGATVTQADYFGYHYSTTSSPTKTCEIRSYGTLDPVTAAASAMFTQSYSGALYNAGFEWGGATYGWHSGTLNSVGLSDVAAAAGNSIAMGFGYLSGTTTFMYHYGVNGSSTNICYLEVTYFTVPCTGAPGPNSVVAPTFAICPGSFANLSLASSYSVGGITYQWQSATISVGPYTAIPGATNAAISTPTLGSQTYFNVLITCANALSTITATEAAVMVQATTTNSIPYHEGFENLTAENTLPNCSWTANNLGAAALTYTAASSQGRVPHTGSGFASFYYNPAGDRYFYTNGLQLEAGLTYSASLWYTTEYYGYNNWTDLSIMVGPNQSTTGLVQIASTNGSAISSVYKSLSNTFSVATSGIYYVAVKADVHTNSYAYYLSWDDLNIIIPCSLNSPSVSLATNVSSVCANSPVVLTATGADTYNWSTGATTNSITELPQANTTYYVVGTSSLSSCSTTLSQMIQVKPSPNVLVYTSSSPTVCAGKSVVLNVVVENGVTYLWNNNTVGPINTVSPLTPTTYTVVGTNAFGCVGTATQAIAINPSPTITASGVPANEMCVGETLVLTGSGANTYEWISSATSEFFQGNPISVNPTSSTTYSIIGTDGKGCTSMIALSQIVNECVGINENVSESVGVYPNPTFGKITFQLNNTSLKTFEVTDVAGKNIMTSSSSQQTVNVDLTHLASGVYYVKIKSDSGMKVVKVVKQ